MQRLAALMQYTEDNVQGQRWVPILRDNLQKLGWIEGRNLHTDYRWGGTDINLLQRLAKEIVAAKPDVIFSSSSSPTRILRQETSTIPIIFGNIVDPIGQGLVTSMAQPGGNVTGFVNLEPSVTGKYLELLKEIAPRVSRVGVLRDPATSGAAGQLGAIQGAASLLRVELTTLDVREPAVIERSMALLAREPNGGLIVLANPTATVHLNLIVALAAQHQLPAIYPYRYFAEAGGLISYGADNLDLYRRAASYVDRILKGGKPADLPVQNPTKFELTINRRTAKALGLDVPPTLLAQADEVIE